MTLFFFLFWSKFLCFGNTEKRISRLNSCSVASYFRTKASSAEPKHTPNTDCGVANQLRLSMEVLLFAKL